MLACRLRWVVFCTHYLQGPQAHQARPLLHQHGAPRGGGAAWTKGSREQASHGELQTPKPARLDAADLSCSDATLSPWRACPMRGPNPAPTWSIQRWGLGVCSSLLPLPLAPHAGLQVEVACRWCTLSAGAAAHRVRLLLHGHRAREQGARSQRGRLPFGTAQC